MSLPLNASTQYLTITDNAVLTLPDADWTIAGWVKITSNAGSFFQYFLSWGGFGATPSINWYFNEASASQANQLRFNLKDGSGNPSLGLSAGTYGTSVIWQHLTLQRSSGTITQYVDDVADGTDTPGSFDVINRSSAFYLGCRSDLNADRMFYGKMAEWAKWDSALSSANITALAGGAQPGDVGSPAWWLPLVDDKESDAGGLTTALAGAPSFDAADHPVSYGNRRRRVICCGAAA